MVSNKNRFVRYFVQSIFFLTILLISVSHQFAERGIIIPFISSASLHSVCPFGGVVSIYTLITDGTFVQKIHEAAFVILGIVLFSAILFGPVFCGWVCPLGTIQEWFGKLGKKIFKNKYNKFIPYKYDRYLRFLRYGVLGWVVYMTANTGKLVFSEVDPYFALFNFWSSEAAITGIIILIATLVLSLFVERPWCKYACPLGAVLGLSNLLRVFKIRRNPNTCVNCKKCDNTCPMNIEISNKEKVTNHQCISCLQCTSEAACPIENTINLKTIGGKQFENKK
jgi:polyferredoxin